jgi:PAS domain S-box-containing protein
VRKDKATGQTDGQDQASGPQSACIFDEASDFIFVVDPDFRIVSANKSFLDILGSTADQVVERTCHEVVHGTADPPAVCPHLKAITEGGSVVQQAFGSRGGTHVLLSVIPMFGASGRLLATVHVGRVVHEGQAGRIDGSLSPHLTPRQKAVLELLTEGRSSKEIASQMGLSPRTVEFHKRQLMARLKVNNIAGLIRFAFLEDLIG